MVSSANVQRTSKLKLWMGSARGRERVAARARPQLEPFLGPIATLVFQGKAVLGNLPSATPRNRYEDPCRDGDTQRDDQEGG